MRKEVYCALIGVMFALLMISVAAVAFADSPLVPETLVIGTMKVGSGGSFNLGVGLVDMLKKHSTLRIAVMPQTGEAAMLALIRDGLAQLGVIRNYYSAMANCGTGLFEGRGMPLRLLFIAYAVEQGLVSAADANIRTINDLRGRKVSAHFTGAPEEEIGLRGQLAMRGLTYKDIIPITVASYNEGVRAVTERRSDVAHTGLMVTPLSEELIAARGMRPVPGDTSPEAVKRVAGAAPGYQIVTLSVDDESLKWLKGNPNFTEKLVLLKFWFYVVTTPKLSNGVAYEFTKAVWANYEELAPLTPRFSRDLRPGNMVTTSAVIPYHPGAIKWLKEKGVWSSEMEQLQQRLLAKSVK